MKLFQPNNLSRRRPEFELVDDPLLIRVVRFVLSERYGLDAVSGVSVFVGANVSTQNLKIETSDAKLFLKSRERSAEKKMRAEAELTFALAELGQPVPRIVRTRRDELMCMHEDNCWVLYEFQEGDYFSGKGDELRSAAETFGELSHAAKKLDTDQTDKMPDRLQELLELASHKSTDYPEIAALCATHSTMMIESLRNVEQNPFNGRCLPVHLDYHPLNLLMNDEHVTCVVDLEHLKRCRVEVGLGFAAYKLIRQAMVDDEFRARESRQPTAVATWLRGWQKSFPEDDFTTRDLGMGARARILTLIQLILDRSLNHNDPRLNYDLEKQILSLYEVDVVFV